MNADGFLIVLFTIRSSNCSSWLSYVYKQSRLCCLNSMGSIMVIVLTKFWCLKNVTKYWTHYMHSMYIFTLSYSRLSFFIYFQLSIWKCHHISSGRIYFQTIHLLKQRSVCSCETLGVFKCCIHWQNKRDCFGKFDTHNWIPLPVISLNLIIIAHSLSIWYV